MAVRIYIDATRVTVSKPGYDAQFPPAVDYKYLSLDSRLNQGRPLEVGVIPAYTFLSGAKILYSGAYPTPPAVDIVLYNLVSGVAAYGQTMVMRDANSSTAIQRSPFAVQCFKDGFIPDDSGLVFARYSRLHGVVYRLFYIAWKVW
ncbi:hypothetical protein [Bradyrhizobium erythrophlei]|uniref:Uncharacterized protein n=1 Tax=Bradyrhizobium erythrophlei TaxID=1437360 RepID=A0A1H4NXG1_9BRAD|nr:hypothetical protein [Bradyrhizobium erythrophlei]SEB99725.1 hypothetical protein SAMN05444164_0757 [Bradyrhizobium erythrophlei]